MRNDTLAASAILVTTSMAICSGFGETTLISKSTLGAVGTGHSRAVAVSGNGRFVAFCSFADNLVQGDSNGTFDVFVRDMLLDVPTRVSVSSTGEQGNGASGLEDSHPHWKTVSISYDGTVVGFESDASNLVPGDTNGKKDIFVRNLKSGVLHSFSGQDS